MTLTSWLDAALRDAEQRNLPRLKPLVENLARSTAALRAASWNVAPTDAADAPAPPAPEAR